MCSAKPARSFLLRVNKVITASLSRNTMTPIYPHDRTFSLLLKWHVLEPTSSPTKIFLVIEHLLC